MICSLFVVKTINSITKERFHCHAVNENVFFILFLTAMLFV